MPRQPRSPEAVGLLQGAGAYVLWGFAPAYWKVLRAFDPAEVLAHRILWALVVAMALVAWTRGFPDLRAALRTGRRVGPVGLAAVLLAMNWLVFIFAVASGQVLATSLGYYLNPLINVLLGLAVLGERLRRVQWIAVAIAAAGVAQYVYVLGELPWISVVLATSFGLYGLVRKLTSVEPVVGFGVETALLAPPALAWVVWLMAAGRAALPVGSLGMDCFIAASGLVTAAPLVLFNGAARRLPLVTVGILQYIAPSIGFVLAVVAYGEPFEAVHVRTFGCVWLALLIFTGESVIASRRAAFTLSR